MNITECVHMDTRTIYIWWLSMACPSISCRPRAMHHGMLRLAPAMYHIPLAHSNLQLRWLLHVVIYLTQYIWNDRYMSENFSVQYWHVYVGSPQWLIPLGKRISVTRLSLGQGYLMELVCDITIGMPPFTLVLLLHEWCHSIVYCILQLVFNQTVTLREDAGKN